MVRVDGRVHRENSRIPAEALIEERARLHRLPSAPHTIALGQTRVVREDQAIRLGSVRPGLADAEVWVTAAGNEEPRLRDISVL